MYSRLSNPPIFHTASDKILGIGKLKAGYEARTKARLWTVHDIPITTTKVNSCLHLVLTFTPHYIITDKGQLIPASI